MYTVPESDNVMICAEITNGVLGEDSRIQLLIALADETTGEYIDLCSYCTDIHIVFPTSNNYICRL